MISWVLFLVSYSRYHLVLTSIFTMLWIYRVKVTAKIENISQKPIFSMCTELTEDQTN